MKGRRIQPDRDVPVVVPQLVAVVQDDGRLRLSANGRTETEPVGRTELGRALSRIAAEASGPVRVEVRETNGASHADIIEPASEAEDVEGEVLPAASLAATYEGFLADEEILIAVVDRVRGRTPTDGSRSPAGVRLHTRRERRGKRDVIAFGSTSGTTIIGAID